MRSIPSRSFACLRGLEYLTGALAPLTNPLHPPASRIACINTPSAAPFGVCLRRADRLELPHRHSRALVSRIGCRGYVSLTAASEASEVVDDIHRLGQSSCAISA